MKLLDIPEELVEEILCRVPATSLKRLRYTCKQWNSFFNDSKFSSKHFDKAAKQYLVVLITKELTLCSLSVKLRDRIPSVEVTGELGINQVRISDVFHCDGLLLCTDKEKSRPILVWNPCTGQTKWIQTTESRLYKRNHMFALGNYRENKSGKRSYKILSYTKLNGGYQEFDIYDINSNSWKNPDVSPIQEVLCFESPVSLKGKTYWFVRRIDSIKSSLGLMSFDYKRERFERLPLPCEYNFFVKYALSVVGEEKLSVLLQCLNYSRSEVWITNKIDDETKEMSWSKLFEVEFGTGHDMWNYRRFLVDEEKKIVVCCERDHNGPEPVIAVSIVGADSNATRGYFPVKTVSLAWPFLMNYVPSLIQIQ